MKSPNKFFSLNLLFKPSVSTCMKKFLLSLLIIFFAYVTAWYTSGASEKQDLFEVGNSPLLYKIKSALSGETDTTDGIALYSRAERYMDQENYDLAIKDYKRAVQLNPDLDYVNIDLAKAYLLSGDTSAAISCLRNYITTSQYPNDAYIELATLYETRGMIDSSLFYYNEAAEKTVDNHFAYYSQANLLFEKNEFEKALDKINSAIDLDQNDLNYRNLRRKIYLKLNQLNPALQEYTYILFKDPDYFGDYAEKAKEANKDGEYQKAVEYYTLAIENQGDNKDLLQERGWVYHSLQKYDSALIDFKKAMEISPDYYSYFNVAYTLDLLDDVKGAIEYYNKSIKEKNDYYLAYNNRGYEYYRLKKYKNAEADYTQSVKLKADYYLSYYNRGLLYFEQKKYKKAIDDYKMAQKFMSDGLSVNYDIALSYDKLKNKREALYYFNEYLKNAGETDSARVNYSIERVADLSK